MRKFQGRTRTRVLCAGFMTAATVAAAVAIGATPAFAATNVALTITPSSGGLTGTLNLSGTNFLLSMASPAAYFTTTNCSGNGAVYGGSPPATVATINKLTDSTATVTLPTGAAALSYNSGAPRTYYLCVFAGTGAGDVIAGSGTYTVANPTLSSMGGLASGNVTVTSTGAFTGVTAPSAVFSTAVCPATYTTSSVITTTVARTNDDQVSVAVPAGLTLNTGAARAYYVCVYNGITAGTSPLNLSSSYTLAPGATTVTPAAGVSGAGTGAVTITMPTASAIFANSTYYVGFASNGCPSAYNLIPAARQSGTFTKVSTTSATATIPAGVGGVNNQTFNVCIYSAATGDTLVGTSALNTYTVSNAGSSLSSTVGAGSAITVTLTSTNVNAFTSATTPAAVFFPQTGTTQYCPGSYTATGGTAAQDTRKISATKASIQFPVSALASGAYTVCVYLNNSTGKLLAYSTYTVAPVPSLSSVSPGSGPALGGNTITVTGANLPSAANSIQITIGNIPVEPAKVTPIDDKTFTLVAPPHSMGSASIVVKTDIGTATLSGAYKYVNSLSVSPNSASNLSNAVSLDIFGTNFLDYDFSTAAAAAGPHVYLVHGTYDGTGSAGIRANVNVLADCAGVLVVNDNELVCSLDLTAAVLNDGTKASQNGSRTVALTGGAGSNTVTTTTVSFTLADVGKTIAYDAAKIDNGTIITQVLDSKTAVLNKAPLGTLTAVSETVGYASASPLTITSTAAGATTLTAAASTFTQADVGRYLSGTGVTAGTYVTSVNDAGSSASISQGVAAATVAVSTNDSNAVPPGAYNIQLVGNATPGGVSTNSVLSSGSTFTVSSF